MYKTNNLDNTLLIFRLNYIKHLVYALRLQPLQQLSFYFPDFDYFYFTSSTSRQESKINGISIMSKILFLITALTTVQAVTYVIGNFSFYIDTRSNIYLCLSYFNSFPFFFDSLRHIYYIYDITSNSSASTTSLVLCDPDAKPSVAVTMSN